MFPTDTDYQTKVTLETEMSPLADDDLPFKLLFLGDWRGRRQSLVVDAPKSRPIEIDRDNFDSVMRKYNVGLDLAFEDGGNNLSLEFTELDDFHPDKIFQQVPLFSDLREIRRKLSNAATYNEAAREVRSWIKSDKNSDEAASKPEVSVGSGISTDNLLDQILGQTDSESTAPQKPNATSSELSAFVGKLVKPYLIQTDTEEQANLLLAVDEITTDLMRKILHHPQFQALESAWRGVYLLVRKIETDSNLKIYLFDISKSELSDSLRSADDLTENQIYRLFNDAEYSWALAGGNYDFNLNVDDAAALIRLAKIGYNANIPFVSHIQPEMFGLPSFDDFPSSHKLHFFEDSTEVKLWNVLRSLPEATHLGLLMPRFLARLPYGAKTEPAETFYFEEFTAEVKHEQYLWANPAFICAILLAQSFNQSGWNLAGNLIQNFEGLPLYFYEEESETKSKSCTEIIMTQSNAELMIEKGLMPLISFRDTDRVRVGRFQSITFSESMLSGKWE